jgi:hypothetical protein
MLKMLLQYTEKESYSESRRVPNHGSFFSVDRQLRETRILHRMRWDVGRLLSVRSVWMEGQILEVVERQHTISTRSLAGSTNTFYTSVPHSLTRTAVVSLSHSLMQVLLPHDRSQWNCKTCIPSMDIATSVEVATRTAKQINGRIVLHYE